MRKRWFVFTFLLLLVSCAKKNNNNPEPDVSPDDGIFHYEEYNDGYKLVSIDDTSLESITIPEKYNKKNIISIKNDVFSDCKNLKQISLPSNLESISTILFTNTKVEYNGYNNGYYLGNKKHPYLYLMKYNNDVTSTKIHDETRIISDNVFKNFRLKNIELNDSLYKISVNAFYNNDDLVSIKIPSSVKVIEDEAFYSCDNLYEIYNFSSLDIKLSSIDYGYIAYNARIINKDNGESKISINDNYILMTGEEVTLLKYLGNGKNIIIPNNVDIIGANAFKSSSIEEVDLSGVKKVEASAFENCAKLKSVITGDDLIEIGANAFKNDEKLMELTLGNKVNFIGKNAFKDCRLLSHVYYDGDEETWANIVFDYASITEMYSNPMYYASRIFFLYDTGYHQVIDLDIPSTVESIKIGQFMNFKSIETICFEGNIKSIEAYAFKGCESVEEFFVPLSISLLDFGILEGCTSLKKIYFSSNVKEINNIFGASNIKLDGIYFDGQLSDWMQISFLNQYAQLMLHSDVLYFGHSTYDTITIDRNVLNYTFMNCKWLKNLYITNNSTEILIFGAYAFSGCEIENVYFSGTIDDWIKLRFSDYTSNPIHNGANLYVYNNGAYELVENPVISTNVISAYSFYHSNIYSIVLPEKLVSIGFDAFAECSLLIDVYYLGNEEEYGKIMINRDASRIHELHIYYYSETEPTSEGYYWHYVSNIPTKW